jgi:hypothetical protein
MQLGRARPRRPRTTPEAHRTQGQDQDLVGPYRCELFVPVVRTDVSGCRSDGLAAWRWPAPAHLRHPVWLTGLWLLSVTLWPLGAVGAEGPTIRLFPTTVLEDIQQTGQVAKNLETGLQDVIARLDQQQQLYRASKCEGAEEDPGCARIARQLGATYLEMLDIMGGQLPEMERTVNNTYASLQRRLRSELGQKMSPWTLQETLLGQGEGRAGQSRPALRGRSGMRLSDRFRQYYQLVAHSRDNSGRSLAVIASDIYLDMQEASELIARTREEINRARLMEQLNQSFGLVTPEMQEVVTGVKSILFGEEELQAPIAGPPPLSGPQAYESPLKL